MDNSGENRMLQAKTNQQNLGINLNSQLQELHKNSVVERKFPTLKGSAMAMITHAGFDDHFKRNFWCEAVSSATKLNNMMVRHMGGKPPYYHVFKEHPKYRKHLRIFGEIGVSQS